MTQQPRIIAFVMDPIERVNPLTDTTYALMRAAAARGHRPVFVPPTGISLRDGAVLLQCFDVELGPPPRRLASFDIKATDCAAVFLRTDPPFDVAYLTATWLLSFAEQAGVRVVNSPAGVRSANEKLYAQNFPALCPRTLISAQRQEILAFVAHEREAIAKPLDGHGGFGVFVVKESDSNTLAIIDSLTQEGKRPIVVQERIRTADPGDKRLLVVNGELRGVVKRVPSERDHRSNVHVGGTAVAAEADADDVKIVDALRGRLKADGLFFVGLDVMGGRLLEVNVTSPTLVQELLRLGGPDLADEIICGALGPS